MKPWALLATTELKLLVRSPLVVATAVLCPLAMGLLLLGNEELGGAGVVSMQLLALLGFTPYAGATTTLAARRQQLVLKRLRTSAASERAIIAGVLLPLALLMVVQAAVLVGTTVVVTGSRPHAWWPLLPAVAGGTVLAVALAFVTAAFTATPELAQVTTLPVFLALFGGGLLALTNDSGWASLAVPGAPVAQLIRLGWDGSALTAATVLLPLVSIVVTTLAATWLATRVFRWQPRS